MARGHIKSIKLQNFLLIFQKKSKKQPPFSTKRQKKLLPFYIKTKEDYILNN